jgi:hypothetical protein
MGFHRTAMEARRSKQLYINCVCKATHPTAHSTHTGLQRACSFFFFIFLPLSELSASIRIANHEQTHALDSAVRLRSAVCHGCECAR